MRQEIEKCPVSYTHWHCGIFLWKYNKYQWRHITFHKKMTKKFPFLTEIYTILIPVKNKGFNFTMGEFNDFHFHLLMFKLYKGKEDRLDLNSNFQFSIQPHFQCKNLQWKSLPTNYTKVQKCSIIICMNHVRNISHPNIKTLQLSKIDIV